MIRVKRVYDPPDGDDGLRVLVDRLWPRGVSKEAGKIDLWLRDVAPSTELRRWFGHDPAKWDEFQKRYFHELDGNPEAVAALRDLVLRKRVTLLYGKRDTEHNNAAALKEYLLKHES